MWSNVRPIKTNYQQPVNEYIMDEITFITKKTRKKSSLARYLQRERERESYEKKITTQ